MEDFFTNARSIRQVYSLSPYFYGILNNVLSKLLDGALKAGEFAYHPQCKEVKLSNLSFADDILAFTYGISESLLVDLEIMQRFT